MREYLPAPHLSTIATTAISPRTAKSLISFSARREDGSESAFGVELGLVDACVQRNLISDADDYFLIEESRLGALAVMSVLRTFVEDNGVRVRDALVPFVCGARQNTENSLIRAADRLDAQVRDAVQPLGIDERVVGDTKYVDALAAMSSYVFERAALKPGAGRSPNSGVSSDGVHYRISFDEFRIAADVIKDRTKASSVLFLGVLGGSLSTGKALAQSIGRGFVGLTVGVLTAGLGTGYYLVFVPGNKIDGRVMQGALVDLQSGTLMWSNAVRAGGDAIDPRVMADREALELLFRGIMFVPTTSPPLPQSSR